jgi:hypothetical protein
MRSPFFFFGALVVAVVVVADVEEASRMLVLDTLLLLLLQLPKDSLANWAVIGLIRIAITEFKSVLVCVMLLLRSSSSPLMSAKLSASGVLVNQNFLLRD